MGLRQRQRVRLVNGLYHVYTRGVRRSAIFLTDEDRAYFLKMLERAVKRYDVCICSYCLMDNHIHLLLRTPNANLSESMQMLLASYARHFNRTHELTGHVLEDRFFSPIVEPGWPFLRTSVYIHRNPVVARMVERAEDYPWSSYRAMLHPDECPAWLCAREVLSYLSGTPEEVRREYKDIVTTWKDEDPIEALRYYERRIAVGSERFRRKWGDSDEDFEEHAKETDLTEEELVSLEVPELSRVLQTIEDVFECSGLFVRGRERPPHDARLAAALVLRSLGWQQPEIGAAIGGFALRTVARYLVRASELLEDGNRPEFRRRVAACLRRLGRPVPEEDLPGTWRSGEITHQARHRGRRR